MQALIERSLCCVLFLIFMLNNAWGYGRKDFSSYGPGVAASGYGDAGTSYCNDISAYYFNPSLLSKFNYVAVSASHFILFEGANYSYLAFGYPLKNAFGGLSIVQLDSGKIETRQNIQDAPQTTSAKQYLIALSYAKFLERANLSLGINMKYYYQNLQEYKSGALGLDLGASRNTFGPYIFGTKTQLFLGLNIKNLYQPVITLIEDADRFPTIITLGTALQIPILIKHLQDASIKKYGKILTAMDFEFNTDYNEVNIRPGLEYELLEKYFIRLGWHDNITFGLGFRTNNFQFDYSFINRNYTNFNKFGFTYKYGVKREIEEETIPALTEEFGKIYNKANKTYEKLYKNAVYAMENANFTEAISLFRKAIPLRQKEKNAAEKLLDVCKGAIVLEEINDNIWKAKLHKNKGEIIKSYQFYLNVFDLSSKNEQNEIVPVLNEIYEIASNDNRLEIDKIRDDYVKHVQDSIDSCLLKKDFETAAVELSKLKLIMPDSDFALVNEKKIQENKSVSLEEYLDKFNEYQSQDKLAEAYESLVEAEKINPDDREIKEQIKVVQEKFFLKKQFKIEDNIYSDKTYYLSAINLAVGEKLFAINLYNELKNFNPVYQWLPRLKEALVHEGLIEK